MTRTRRILSGCIGTVMIVLFVYVGVRFPDWPIQKCVPGTAYAITQHPSGYCGKQGQPHTAEDFHAFEMWETILIYAWPVGIAALAVLQYMRPRPRRGAENSN
jgi:hypothetical protein